MSKSCINCGKKIEEELPKSNLKDNSKKSIQNEFYLGIDGYTKKYGHEDSNERIQAFQFQNVPEVESTIERVGILGGTFDPIHNGHVALGMAAIEEAKISKLIVMPAYIQPFKQGKRVTDDEHRLAMATLAFDGLPKVEVSPFEIDRMRISYTFDTLSSMKKIYPNSELWFITGTDTFLTLDSWYKGIDLLKNFSFIVSVRPGYEEEALDEKLKIYQSLYHTKVMKLTSNMPEISATEIREKCKMGQSFNGLVPEKVERYIKAHGLYQRD